MTSNPWDTAIVVAEYAFTVRGIPVTQGSMRPAVSKYGTPYAVQDHRSNLIAWRHAVNDEVRDAFAGHVALEGVAYLDDAQVVAIRASKRFSSDEHQPGLEAWVEGGVDG